MNPEDSCSDPKEVAIFPFRNGLNRYLSNRLKSCQNKVSGASVTTQNRALHLPSKTRLSIANFPLQLTTALASDW